MSLVAGTLIEATATFKEPDGTPFDPITVEAHLENRFKQKIVDAISVTKDTVGIYIGVFQTTSAQDSIIVVFVGEGPTGKQYVGRTEKTLPYTK